MYIESMQGGSMYIKDILSWEIGSLTTDDLKQGINNLIKKFKFINKF